MIYSLTDDLFIQNGALVGKVPVKLRQHDNRLWAVCDDGSLVFSNNGDASTWDALNIILAPNREQILDFVPLQGGAILVTKTAIYAFYGSGTYQDTSILLLQDGLLLADSAVLVGNMVYVVGARGIHVASLNGVSEVPAAQDSFFQEAFQAWLITGSIKGIYLFRFHAILYLFPTALGVKGFLFYVRTGAVCKLTATLPDLLPYMVELYDSSTDFLVAGSSTTINRSIYPSGVLTSAREAVMQTRHEDADSTRDKVWRHLGIVADGPAYNVAIRAYLNYSDTPTALDPGIVNLAEGDNIIELYDDSGNILRGKAISIELTIGNRQYLIDDETGDILTDDDTGEYLVSDDLMVESSAFIIRELRLKWREVGRAD